MPIKAFASLTGVSYTIEGNHSPPLENIQDPALYTVSALDLGDRMTSSLKGGIALYEAFLHAGLRLPFHPFILTLLYRYCPILAQLTPTLSEPFAHSWFFAIFIGLSLDSLYLG